MAEVKPVLLDSDGFIEEFNPAADSITLNGITLTGDVNMSSSGTVTNLQSPTNTTDAATKGYVDAYVQGLDVKKSCRVVTTSGVGSYSDSGGAGGTGQLTSCWDQVDDVTVVEGDRVLVLDQTDAKQNGIYIVMATTSTWDRAVDFDENGEVTANAFTFVSEGTDYQDTGWTLTTNDPITLNTHDLDWAQFSGAGSIIAGAGLSKSGNTMNVELATNPGLDFDAGGVDGKLRIDLDGTTLQLGAAGISVKGVPSQFEIGGSAVSANVTHTNLNTLTAGVASDADALHTHDGLASSGHNHSHDSLTGRDANNHHNELHTVASHSDTTATGPELDELTDGSETVLHSHAVTTASGVENIYNADTGGVTDNYPVYFSGNDVVSNSDAANANATKTVGVSLTTAGSGNPATIVSHGEAGDVLVGATAGDYYYLAVGGGLTTTRPVGAYNRIVLMGTAINATDLYVDIQFLGRVGGP